MWRLNFFILSLVSLRILTYDECGVVKVSLGLNVGGEYSERGQWPWLVPIFRDGGYKCGSSIISRKHLLSAAHCVHAKTHTLAYPVEHFYAFLGAYDLNKKNNAGKVNFSSIFVHSEWNPSDTSVKYDADISLFVMEREITFNSFVQPICLPTASARIFDVSGTVVGYGLSETSKPHENRQKHIQIESIDQETCLLEEPTYARISSKRMFCAGMQGKNPCQGDSGSPFMVRINRKWTINGIVSTAVAGKECIEYEYVLFTQVAKFLPWIKEKMEDEHPLKCEFYEKICYGRSFEILKPNIQVTSIEPLNLALNNLNVESIDIHRNVVHYLPDFSNIKKKIPNLKAFNIDWSGLKELDRSKLAIFPQLMHLRFATNKIKVLPENVFDDLVNLESLILVENQIKILPQKLLWKLPNLKNFNAETNEIVAIPFRFFEKNSNIEMIHLGFNQIARIGMDFRTLSNLKDCNLRINTCIDSSFNVDSSYGLYTDINKFQRLVFDKCSLKF